MTCSIWISNQNRLNKKNQILFTHHYLLTTVNNVFDIFRFSKIKTWLELE